MFSDDLLKEMMDEHLSIFLHEGFFFSPRVLQVVLQILQDRKFERALDPWADTGLLLSTIAEAGITKSATGIVRQSTEFILARVISGDLPVRWIVSNPDQWMRDCLEQFDLVIGCFPFGLPTRELELNLPAGLARFIRECEEIRRQKKPPLLQT
jgi:hypothetical protein